MMSSSADQPEPAKSVAKPKPAGRVFRWLCPHCQHELTAGLAEVHTERVCPQCERTSYHPMDVQEGYCGACHEFTRGTAPR